MGVLANQQDDQDRPRRLSKSVLTVLRRIGGEQAKHCAPAARLIEPNNLLSGETSLVLRVRTRSPFALPRTVSEMWTTEIDALPVVVVSSPKL